MTEGSVIKFYTNLHRRAIEKCEFHIFIKQCKVTLRVSPGLVMEVDLRMKSRGDKEV